MNAFRSYQPRTEAEGNAQELASQKLRYPFQDPVADERRCLTALRSLCAVYVAIYTESDRLTDAEAAAIFAAMGFLDHFDESQSSPSSQSENRNEGARKP